MPEYRIGQAAELVGVSTDTIRRWADGGRVKTRIGKGGRRSIDGEDLARFATEMAGDETLDTRRRQSARNRFRGICHAGDQRRVAAQGEVLCGPHRFVSLITREAADELGLEPGMIADAVVKATSVGVEIPPEF